MRIQYKSLIQSVLLLTAGVPLFVLSTTPFPDFVPKVFLFRTLVFLALCMTAVGVSVRSTVRLHVLSQIRTLRTNTLLWAIFGLLGALIVSTLCAFDRSVALWGTLIRQEGLISFSLVVLYALLVAIFFDVTTWKRFMQGSVAVALVLCVYQYYQLLHHVDRPGSLIGNPIFLGAYLLCALFFNAVLYRETATRSRCTKVYAVSACVITVGIFITGSRGVLAGLFVAALYSVAHDARLRVHFKKILLVMLFLFAVIGATRTASVWTHIPGVNRIVATSLSKGTARARVIVAHTSVSSLTDPSVPLKHKLFGWGWDNYMYMWQKEYRPELFAYDPGIFDRSHNALLDQLVMNGVFGLCIYGAFWTLLFLKARALSKTHAEISVLAQAFLLAYCIQNLVSFDTAVTSIFFIMIAVYIAGVHRDTVKQSTACSKSSQIVLIAGVLTVFLCVCWAFWKSVYVPYRQVSAVVTGTRLLERGETPSSEEFERAFSLSTSASDEIRIRLLSGYFPPDPAIVMTDATFPVFEKHLFDFGASISATPGQYDSWLTLAKAYTIEGTIMHNPQFLTYARSSFETALALAPKRQDTACEYGLFLMQHGETEQARAVLQNTLAPYPVVPATRYCLSNIEFNSGPLYYNEALANAEYALDSGFTVVPSVTAMYWKFAAYYYEHKDSDHLVVVLRRLKMLVPSQQQTLDGIITYIAEHHALPTIVLQ